jgi:7-carboxy-7-deazaguanine synthase
VACDLMSISPKLANSTPNDRWAAQHDRLRIQPEVLLELMARYPYQLKFVIEKPDDLDEVRALIGALEADRSRVILMPEGTDRDRLRERAVWLAEICKQEGFRFSPRLHVDLWGRRYELSELVARITPKNRHRETDWGEPQGEESW